MYRGLWLSQFLSSVAPSSEDMVPWELGGGQAALSQAACPEEVACQWKGSLAERPARRQTLRHEMARDEALGRPCPRAGALDGCWEVPGTLLRVSKREGGRKAGRQGDQEEAATGSQRMERELGGWSGRPGFR